MHIEEYHTLFNVGSLVLMLFSLGPLCLAADENQAR